MTAIPPTAQPRGAAAAALGAAARAAAAAAATQAAASVTAAAPAPVAFPPEALRTACEAILARYPTRQAALLPVLHLAQRHYGGWVSPEVEAGVAQYLGLPDQHVRGVLTFYAMYHTQPVGRHEVWICRTLSCWLRGAEALTKTACAKAGIPAHDGHGHAGGTDAAGRFTVREMECLGLCEQAPAVFVDGQAHGNVTPQSLDRLLEGCS